MSEMNASAGGYQHTSVAALKGNFKENRWNRKLPLVQRL